MSVRMMKGDYIDSQDTASRLLSIELPTPPTEDENIEMI